MVKADRACSNNHMCPVNVDRHSYFPHFRNLWKVSVNLAIIAFPGHYPIAVIKNKLGPNCQFRQVEIRG